MISLYNIINKVKKKVTVNVLEDKGWDKLSDETGKRLPQHYTHSRVGSLRTMIFSQSLIEFVRY